MQAMVKAQLGMKEVPEPSDAADALAVALCHLQSDRLERRFGVRAMDVGGSSTPKKQKRPMVARHTTMERRIHIQSDR
jgi:hypothetical protein